MVLHPTLLISLLLVISNLHVLILSAGLEKTLRLLQAVTQIIAAYSLTVTSAAPWLQARKQFALGEITSSLQI
jgi:hypothetical protein